MQCYPSYAMYWAVLAASKLDNWTSLQLGSHTAALQNSKESLGDTYTYIHILYISSETIYILYISSESIYKLYLRMCVCLSLSHSMIMKAPNQTSTPLKVNGRPRYAIQIIREIKHLELH